jgi:hypothetical protein
MGLIQVRQSSLMVKKKWTESNDIELNTHEWKRPSEMDVIIIFQTSFFSTKV